jgi:hypothetical protein
MKRGRMIILGLMSFLLGYWLGRCFRVSVLGPASIAVALGGAIDAHFEAAGFAMTLVMIASPVILLQLGYVAGLI